MIPNLKRKSNIGCKAGIGFGLVLKKILSQREERTFNGSFDKDGSEKNLLKRFYHSQV